MSNTQMKRSESQELTLRSELSSLLEFLIRHKDSLWNVIEEYERIGPAAIPDSWYKASLKSKVFTQAITPGWRSGPATKAPVDRTLDGNRGLKSKYKYLQLSRRAETEDLREMFENLAQDSSREETELTCSQINA